MSLSMLSVRIPETVHTYLKHTAVARKQPLQTIVSEALTQYQAQDSDYTERLNQAGISAFLQATAPAAETEAPHDA